jgi:hypothetical protein
MGPIRKARDAVSSHAKRESEAKAASAQAKAARAEAERAQIETEIAQEQAMAISRALQQDGTHPQADVLHEVAEKEAEAVPRDQPDEPGHRRDDRPSRQKRTLAGPFTG